MYVCMYIYAYIYISGLSSLSARVHVYCHIQLIYTIDTQDVHTTASYYIYYYKYVSSYSFACDYRILPYTITNVSSYEYI